MDQYKVPLCWEKPYRSVGRVGSEHDFKSISEEERRFSVGGGLVTFHRTPGSSYIRSKSVVFRQPQTKYLFGVVSHGTQECVGGKFSEPEEIDHPGDTEHCVDSYKQRQAVSGWPPARTNFAVLCRLLLPLPPHERRRPAPGIKR